MKLLLDTHLLVWAIGVSKRLSAAADALMRDPANELIFSAASIWELAIKSSRPRPDLQFDPPVLRRTLLDIGYQELSITGLHMLTIVRLPALHKDPFDRLLVAQAISEGILLLTSDPVVARYPGPIRLV